jgi:hypothetical protein
MIRKRKNWRTGGEYPSATFPIENPLVVFSHPTDSRNRKDVYVGLRLEIHYELTFCRKTGTSEQILRCSSPKRRIFCHHAELILRFGFNLGTESSGTCPVFKTLCIFQCLYREFLWQESKYGLPLETHSETSQVIQNSQIFSLCCESVTAESSHLLREMMYYVPKEETYEFTSASYRVRTIDKARLQQVGD